ncbi:MAG: DUF4261 domain-containing protein [Planctomycetota bacterium]
MPQKGLFTQGVALLCSVVPSLDALAAALPDWQVLARPPAAEYWALSGPALVYAFPRPPNGTEGAPPAAPGPGRLIIDVLDRPWPDEMGDPKTDPPLFMAWGSGQFGPFAWPHSLARATELGWFLKDAATIVPTHTAFVRMRITYATRPEPDAPLFPDDYKPLDEIWALAEVVAKLFELPGVLCYFNPNGELLMAKEPFRAKLAYDREQQILPADLFCNVRIVSRPGNLLLVDTVGLDQFDLSDQEAVFPRGQVPLDEAANFLFNVAHFLNEKGEVIRNANTMNSSEKIRWTVRHMKESLVAPPRETMRWLPVAWQNPPVGAIDPAQIDLDG